MTWWCSAGSVAWTWQWQAYPGVWLFVLALVAGYAWLEARVGREQGRRRWFAAGVVVLWLALDWPVGALGAGYLASVHMLQYLLVALVAPPLLLLGFPSASRPGARGQAEPSLAGGLLRLITRPLPALIIFSLVVYATHLPRVVDGLMVTQAGSFLIDMLWLSAGLVFWRPVVAPASADGSIPHPIKMGYLFLATVINTLPYAFLTFGELPFYGIYELAPPVAGLTARQDQQIAGLLMKGGGGAILWSAITIVFFRWVRGEQALEGVQANPVAGEP